MTNLCLKKLNICFYRTNNGSEPVRNWLRKLEREEKKVIGEDIKTIQFGWPLGMPLVRGLGDGLWEVRSNLHNGKIARVIFFIESATLILVHGFIKKTQKIPLKDLALAKIRKKSFDYSRDTELEDIYEK